MHPTIAQMKKKAKNTQSKSQGLENIYKYDCVLVYGILTNIWCAKEHPTIAQMKKKRAKNTQSKSYLL